MQRLVIPCPLLKHVRLSSRPESSFDVDSRHLRRGKPDTAFSMSLACPAAGAFPP